MTTQFDILVKNCQLRGQPEARYDIGIAGGTIAALGKNLSGKVQTVLDAGGNLVTESFVNTHLHLCKVYTLPMMDELAMEDYQRADMGKAMTAIELAARVKESYDESWIIKNVRKAVALSAIYGGTHMRAFADVDSKAKLIGVKALIRAREEFKGIVDIQVVAFAQDGIVREPGAADLVRQAMQLGADVVGGIPWIEFTDADIARHVEICYDIAEEFDKPVSMLVDDAGDPGLRSLELMALETIRRGWHDRSLAHHARAMAMYPKPYLQKLAALLKQAQMGVVSDPHTGPLHARVRELLEEGVLVCLGMDDISDAYYPFGRNNMLEVAFLASHLLWMTARQDMEILYDMVTTKAAQCIGLEDHALEVGAPANIVVLDEPNVLEALRNHEAPAYVISHGKLVNREKMKAVVETQEWL
ncbi:MAG: amidohydrolase family protein [Chloroflexi bacterium]|nr:amidohydrolase family protein [Chloroflexota bacterium]